jgi:hypothetical protein
VKGEVGSGESEVGEKRRALVVLLVFFEELKGSIGEFGGGVEAGVLFDRREFLVVEVVGVRIEKATLILEIVGTVKSGDDGHAIEMPFPDVIGAVTRWFEQSRGERCPRGPLATSTPATLFSLATLHDVTSHLLRVVATEKGGPGGPASCGVVKVGETEAVLGEGVEVWSFDLRSIAAEVGVTEIIGQDEEDVWLGILGFESRG